MHHSSLGCMTEVLYHYSLGFGSLPASRESYESHGRRDHVRPLGDVDLCWENESERSAARTVERASNTTIGDFMYDSCGITDSEHVLATAPAHEDAGHVNSDDAIAEASALVRLLARFRVERVSVQDAVQPELGSASYGGLLRQRYLVDAVEALPITDVCYAV